MNSNNYHFEARASARCHTQHDRHQGVCRFQNPSILTFTLFKKEIKTQYVSIYNTGENNPIKLAQISLLIIFEIDNEATPREFVVNPGLLTLPLDIFQFRMCQNDHLVITDLCAKFYVNQWRILL